MKVMNRGDWSEMINLMDKIKAVAKKEAEAEDFGKICENLDNVRKIIDEYTPSGLN